MAHIVMTDDGIGFDGRTMETKPLGGAEAAFVGLAEGLAARGHVVQVRNRCERAETVRGVEWAPIEQGVPEAADLYIANRGDKLLDFVPRARRIAFWIHNPANYLLNWRYLSKLWRRRPVIVFCGPAHAATCPRWVPDGGRICVHYGLSGPMRSPDPGAEPPPPRAIFTSNPLRSLAWLIEVWVERIRPKVPGAELHVFSGPQTYGAAGEAKRAVMEPILAKALAAVGAGVRLHEPVAHAVLARELLAARVYLFRGDAGEAFCTSAAEAQAMGVPGVVCDIACMSERVAHEKSGFVVPDLDAGAFAAAAIRILTDDDLWRRQHAGAIAHARDWTWDAAARRFEHLMS